MLQGKQGYSSEIDVWALGVIIYTLLVGKKPFQSDSIEETYKKIRNNCID